MQFHEDAITTLPHGAVLLASAPRYPNRAFRLNRSAYGIQFHIETTTEIVRPWAREAPAMRTSGACGRSPLKALAVVHADLAETWRGAPHSSRPPYRLP
jgi:GMP synthase-like glutamine amidotransferase